MPSKDRTSFVPSEKNERDFNDPDSQRLLTVTARAVAYERGREAAREYFDELLRESKQKSNRKPTVGGREDCSDCGRKR
jgi:hypothetical protein